MKRVLTVALTILLSGGVGALVHRTVTLDRRRVPGDLGSPLLAASGISAAYVENIGAYDVFRCRDSAGTSLMLVNRGGGYISISIPDNDELTPLSVAMVSSTAFLRWSKGDTRVATYASAVDEDGDLGDQVWDLDADGRFDQIKTAGGEELWYLDDRWVKIVQRVEPDEGTLFDLVVTETGQRYRRVGDTWVREPTTSAPGGRNP